VLVSDPGAEPSAPAIAHHSPADIRRIDPHLALINET
jgi:hypothetical protein